MHRRKKSWYEDAIEWLENYKIWNLQKKIHYSWRELLWYFCCIIIFLIVRVCIRILKCLFFPWQKELWICFHGLERIVSVFLHFYSAYGLAVSYMKLSEKKGAADGWIKRRLLKLYKGYWFVFVGAFFICSIIDRMPIKVYMKSHGIANIILDMLGLSAFLGTPSMNGAWWYMSLAVTIIIIVPVVGCLWQKNWRDSYNCIDIYYAKNIWNRISGKQFMLIIFVYCNLWRDFCRKWYIYQNSKMGAKTSFVL